MPGKRKKKADYLNNKKLFNETIISKENGAMTDKLARMLMLLVNHYASRGNWASYTYRDDMEAHAILAHMTSWKAFKEC